jgi:hypothetical protein
MMDERALHIIPPVMKSEDGVSLEREFGNVIGNARPAGRQQHIYG